MVQKTITGRGNIDLPAMARCNSRIWCSDDDRNWRSNRHSWDQRFANNGAGASTGYMLGRKPEPKRVEELERTTMFVGKRLFTEGYTGPAGMDALEHSGGLHPLLEINARYTMGFVALAIEGEMKPTEPVFWSTK